MKTALRILTILACFGILFTARADEPEAVELESAAQPSRWRVSVGARVAPGVKTRATIPSGAIVDVVGGLRNPGGSKQGGALPSGTSTSTDRRTATSTDESSESVTLAADERFEFAGGFIDMNDSTIEPNETWNWHFEKSASFDDATGTLTVPGTPSTTTSHDSSTTRSEGTGAASASVRSSFSEQVLPDATSSHESDLWGADMEIGYDFYVGERLSLGIGLGATFYRGDDAIRAAGRCYAASSSTRSETASGRFVTTTATTVDTAETTTETLSVALPEFAGAIDDLRNDDESFGAGTATGEDNIYGGNTPTITLSDGTITKTTTTDTTTDTTVETTRTFEATGSKTSHSSVRRTIDVAADGDVETQELRLALQPAWRATDWLELRGSFGAVATRVDVDVDAAIFVNGARFATVSGSDDDWVFAGLCGLDAVFTPLDWLEFTLGGDIRLGDTEMDYRAGLVRGSVELARYTFRAGIGVSF